MNMTILSNYSEKLTIPYLNGEAASIAVTPYNPLDGLRDVFLDVSIYRHTYFLVRRLGYWERNPKYGSVIIDMRTKSIQDVQDAVNEMAERYTSFANAAAITSEFSASSAQ